MAAVTKMMDSIVILDDEEEPSSSSWHPQTSCVSSTSSVTQTPAAHVPESPHAVRVAGRVRKLENEKLFSEVGWGVRKHVFTWMYVSHV